MSPEVRLGQSCRGVGSSIVCGEEVNGSWRLWSRYLMLRVRSDRGNIAGFLGVDVSGAEGAAPRRDFGQNIGQILRDSFDGADSDTRYPAEFVDPMDYIRVFVGTVSEFCAKHAECPVITIKRKPADAPPDPIDD